MPSLRLAVLIPVIAVLGLAVQPGNVAHGASGAVVAVTSGSSANHTCAVTADHRLLCWGENSYGQLGDGTVQNRTSPVEVLALAGTAGAVAAGHHHTCALTLAGGVLCWGRNSEGQLGDGSTRQRLAPVAVVGLGSGVVAIGAGFAHTCALLATGGVRCWGNNFHGQIGDGTAGNAWNTPRDVVQLAGAAAISAGDWHNCALLTSGGLRCWGENLHGQLGNGQSGVNQQSTPVAVALNGRALGVAAGAVHTCALVENRSVKCWGRNTYGQLGTGTVGGIEETPVQVNELTGVVTIAAGGAHSCATTVPEVALCWGRNEYGQIGDGTTNNRPAPVAAGGPVATSITAGEAHTCASRPGEVVCWGRNDLGQLGLGNTVSPGRTGQAVPELAASVGGLAELTDTASAGGGRLGGFIGLAFASFAALAVASQMRLRQR